jgi:hypothetical protein
MKKPDQNQKDSKLTTAAKPGAKPGVKGKIESEVVEQTKPVIESILILRQNRSLRGSFILQHIMIQKQ